MAGIYIHIPFCRKACSYCNFHFSTSFKLIDPLIESIKNELIERKNEFSNQEIETIYFGGGTPSLLTDFHLQKIFNVLQQHYSVENTTEITLEANPEDITKENLLLWKSMNINRLSIGLQSLNDQELIQMNRNHTAEQSKIAVELALEFGFQHITVDFIYGTPWKSDIEWEQELSWALESGINHLSAYALTIEPKTILAKSIQKSLVQPPTDERMESQFYILQNMISKYGWDAYEISNYCKPNHQAIHNGNYWAGKPYLGIGPSAHSFQNNTRRWNISNNAMYIKNIESNIPYFELEYLTDSNQFNEYLMTQLRTSKGIDLNFIDQIQPNWQISNKKSIDQFLSNRNIKLINNYLMLTNSGKLISDYIISSLMI